MAKKRVTVTDHLGVAIMVAGKENKDTYFDKIVIVIVFVVAPNPDTPEVAAGIVEYRIAVGRMKCSILGRVVVEYNSP